MNLGNIKEFSDFLLLSARHEAEYHPIDRFYIEKYINKIKQFEKRSFLLQNFTYGLLYSVQLMICLPDIWREVTMNDVNWLLRKFRKEDAYYSLILFMYKYIEIDIVEYIFKGEIVSDLMKQNIKSFFLNQYFNLYKNEYEITIFEEGLIGIDGKDWEYVKQVFLLDSRISPVTKSPEELRNYFDSVHF